MRLYFIGGASGSGKTAVMPNLKKYGFEILLKESGQDQHLVWIAKKNG